MSNWLRDTIVPRTGNSIQHKKKISERRLKGHYETLNKANILVIKKESSCISYPEIDY